MTVNLGTTSASSVVILKNGSDLYPMTTQEKKAILHRRDKVITMAVRYRHSQGTTGVPRAEARLVDAVDDYRYYRQKLAKKYGYPAVEEVAGLD